MKRPRGRLMEEPLEEDTRHPSVSYARIEVAPSIIIFLSSSSIYFVITMCSDPGMPPDFARWDICNI